MWARAKFLLTKEVTCQRIGGIFVRVAFSGQVERLIGETCSICESKHDKLVSGSTLDPNPTFDRSMKETRRSQ